MASDKVKKPRHPKSPSGQIWWSYGKPIRPKKPSEYIKERLELFRGDLTQGVSGEELIEALKAKNSELSVYGQPYDESSLELNIVVIGDYEGPNHSYEQQLEFYNQKYAEYKEELKWWKECKARQDEYEKAEKEEKERNEYERLQKKFEDQSS